MYDGMGLMMDKTHKVVVVGHARSGTSLLYGRLRASLPDACCFFEPSNPTFLQQAQDATGHVVAKLLLPVPAVIASQLGNVFSTRLFLVRDPRDVLVSALLYVGGFEVMWRWEEKRLATALDLLRRKEESPAAIGLLELFAALREDFSLEHITASLRLIDAFLAGWDARYPLGIVRYEDLLSGDIQELEQALGFALAPQVALGDDLRRVARSCSSAAWRSWLTRSDVAILEPLLGETMRRFGYDATEWRLEACPRIPSHHASAYVRRLIHERRALEGWATP